MNYLIIIFVFIFGSVIGSFLNCLIYRLHEKKSLWGRSFCPRCFKMIPWYDNIPVLSFLFLRGHCRHCRKSISWQYPVIEFISGVLFVLAFYMNYEFVQAGIIPGLITHNSLFIIQLLSHWLFISAMIVIFVYDLRWYIIPDSVSLPAVLVLFLANILLGIDWKILALSGIIGAGFFLLQFVISRGKWIGGGDIRLGLLLGTALGWPGVLIALMLAYIIGSIAGVGLILSGKKKWSSQVPLGIFLTTAGIITLFWGDLILENYLRWIY